MQAMKTQSKASRYLALLTVAAATTAVGCGGNEGGKPGSTTDAGGSAEGGTDTGSGGNPGKGGSSARGGSPGTGGGSGGGTSAGGTSAGGAGGGGATGARSCERDCMALAGTACAGADFTQEKCVTDCQKAFQNAAADAKAAGCFNEFLALDACRVNDPVCTHPNPRECVPENDAYIQCLQNSI